MTEKNISKYAYKVLEKNHGEIPTLIINYNGEKDIIINDSVLENSFKGCILKPKKKYYSKIKKHIIKHILN